MSVRAASINANPPRVQLRPAVAVDTHVLSPLGNHGQVGFGQTRSKG
jgi:hypothetical protein